MKKFLLFLYICIFTAVCYSQSTNITLKIAGIQEINGQISIAMFNNEADYKNEENYVVAERIPVISEDFKFVIEGIPSGTYAILVFHDVDSNNKLNKNWIGMPKEPFGFSNDAKGKMGPPDYEDAAFKVSGDTEIIINLVRL